MSTEPRTQLEWLASYDRTTGELCTYKARDCGYGDMLRRGLVTNRGPAEMPDLYITEAGKAFVASYQKGTT